jgi:GNAT superfamily N-acetyltransferase
VIDQGDRPPLPALTFRTATDDDIPRCAEVWRIAINDYVTALNQPAVPDDLLIIAKLYTHFRATDPERFVVAVAPDPDEQGHDRVVAFAIALQRDDVWFLSMLFVLPDVQLRGLGRELLARVLPPPGTVTVRATATDSAQPISNALYSTYGIVPRLPLLGLLGLPSRPEAIEPLPGGVRPVAFETVVDAAGSDGHGRLAAAVDGLDRELLGFSRSVDHRFLRQQQDRRGWLYVGPDGSPLGYGYSSPSGRLGPILVRHPDLLGPALGQLMAAVEPRGPFLTWIPGAADRALLPALAAGLRLEPFPVLLCWDRQPTDFERYLPVSPGML